MAKRIELCIFCDSDPCVCAGEPVKKKRATRKKTDAPKPEPVHEQPGVVPAVAPGTADRPRVRRSSKPTVPASTPSVGTGADPVPLQAAKPTRSRNRKTSDEVRAIRTLNFFGMLSDSEKRKHADILEVKVTGELLKEV